MRRHNLAALALCILCASAPARADDKLTVVSWGGPYEAAQAAAIAAPFAKASGIAVEMTSYAGGLEALRARARPEGWDVIDMTEESAIAACEAGLILPIDPDRVVAPADGVPIEADFTQGAFRDCSVAQILYATVIAYDERAFPGVKPTRLEDFFDVERFPGPRAIQTGPEAILEWALMAEGAPAPQVYDLLSTDRGLRLAIRKLEAIRDHVVWWSEPATPAEMLRDGRAVMASGYNGRFFSMAVEEGAAISIIWDGRVIGYDVWAILADSDQPERARDFVRFATAPERMAAVAERIPYGPARASAFARIGLHAESGVPMRVHLPNAPQHGGRALIRDPLWYARTEALRARRFEAWRQAVIAEGG